jgi:carbon-monoxide dehydrogenase medium subunit
MIPAAFGYERPATLDEALGLLGSNGGSKVLAGGQSLLPLMKLRLASPDKLIDIGRLSELKGHGPTDDGGYRMGALTTYADVLAATKHEFVRECVAGIGDVQVRNRGTVAGSVTHADPASDAPALGLAMDYSAVLRSDRGERTVPLDGFFKGAFETDIAPDEILVTLQRGPLPAGAAGAYRRLENPASGYSMVGVCAILARANGAISHARVAITGVGEVAYRAKAVESALLGSDGGSAAVEAAVSHATDDITVNSDIHADRAYRTAMTAVYTRRAIEAALARLT